MTTQDILKLLEAKLKEQTDLGNIDSIELLIEIINEIKIGLINNPNFD